MRYYYAEINGSDIAKCVIETDRQIESASMISIPSFDLSLLGKHHIGAGVFEDVE